MMPATAAQRMPSQQANFHEKALFVKPTWRLPFG
jgi:hypothetical protein